MTRPPFEVALLDASHDRSRFDCGTLALNRYLADQAGQGMRSRVASCFVAHSDDGCIAGYYTLAAASMLYQHHGFIPLPDAALTLFLPLASVPAQA